MRFGCPAQNRVVPTEGDFVLKALLNKLLLCLREPGSQGVIAHSLALEEQ